MNKNDFKKLKKKYGVLKSLAIEIVMLLTILLFIFCLGGMAGFYDIEKIVFPIVAFFKNILIIVLIIGVLLSILWIIWENIKAIRYKTTISKLPLTDEEYLKLNIITPYDKIAFYKNTLRIFALKYMLIFLSESQEDEIKLIIKDTFFKLLETEDIFINNIAKEYNFNLNKVNVIFISEYEYDRVFLDEILYSSSLGIKFGVIKNLDEKNFENKAYLYMQIDTL